MGLLTALQSIFAPLPEGAIRYKGYTIAATPEQDGGVFRISGVISKKGQQHSFTLVDRVTDRDTCIQRAQQKGKIFIDQKGLSVLA